MTITKNKSFNIQFESGIILANQDYIENKKNIIIDLENLYSDKVKDNGLVIFNPGEYEYSGILVKVFPDNNIFVSSENIKILIVNTVSEDLIKDKRIEAADIFIFDITTSDKTTLDSIIGFQKEAQPKMLVINSDLFKGQEIPGGEKISKIKAKSNDLDLIVEGKVYVI